MKFCCLLAFFLPAVCHAATGLVYSAILNGFSQLTVTAVSTDPSGNFYITGSTNDPGFPATPGVIQTQLHGGSCQSAAGSPINPPPTFLCPDAFVIKLNAQGSIVFATLFGGGGYDQATSIGIDVAGNIYIAGITTSGNLPGAPASGPVIEPTFIAKLNPTATAVLYLTLLPGTGFLPLFAPFEPNVPESETTISMTVDAAGNAYFAASGTSGFPVVGTPLQSTGPMAVGKLNPSGSLVYATYLGGTGGDTPNGIALDVTGSAYITGMTASADFPVTQGALQTIFPGVTNAFVAKLAPAGDKLEYATYLGGPAFTYGTGIRVDSDGDAYVFGIPGSTGFPITSQAFQTTYSGESSGFLSKISPDGSSLIYSTFVTTNALPPEAFDIDAAGNAYLTGQTGPGFPITPDAYQPCLAGGGDDVFITELAPDGMLVASTYLGGSSYEYGYRVAAISPGLVALTGLTNSPDFPATQGSPPGYYAAELHIGDPANVGSPCLTLALQNGASYEEGPIAPGELVTFRGLNLGPPNGVSMQLDQSGKIATSLGGVQVFFDGIAAPLLYAQSEQINAQAPWELAGKTSTQVHVQYNGAATRTSLPTVAPSAPAFFHAYGSTQGAILNQDSSLNSSTNPAAAGSIVQVFGTGGGPTNPAGVTGGVTPLSPFALLTLPVSVTVDGSPAPEITFAGAEPTISSGVFQINFRLPAALPSGSHVINATIGTSSTDPNLNITVAVQ